MAFVLNEPNMLGRIQSYMEENKIIINHLDTLFTDTNIVIIGEKTKYCVYDQRSESVHLVDNSINLFMAYVKNHYNWLVNDKNFSDWLVKQTSNDCIDTIVSMIAFENSEQDYIIFYLKNLEKDNMIEIICRHIAHDIYGAFVSRSIKVE